jgi:hypothetical protein
MSWLQIYFKRVNIEAVQLVRAGSQPHVDVCFKYRQLQRCIFDVLNPYGTLTILGRNWSHRYIIIPHGCARGEAIGSICLSVCLCHIWTSRHLSDSYHISTMNQSKLSKNCIVFIMLRIVWQGSWASRTLCFHWPCLLILPTVGCVLSAHVHNLPQYVSKGHRLQVLQYAHNCGCRRNACGVYTLLSSSCMMRQTSVKLKVTLTRLAAPTQHHTNNALCTSWLIVEGG